MKKCAVGAVKLFVFLLGFWFLLITFQKALHYRWGDLYSANIWLKTQPEDSYDVLYFGTSELKTAVFPPAVFRYAGVTGYNCAVTNRSAMTAYYQLKYALRYQKPKVVCCDFSALYDKETVSERENVYRKVADTLPDRDLKREMIRSIAKADPTQSGLSYYFPIFRYHSMWSELSEENFKEDYVYDEEEYTVYKMGCMLTDIADKSESYEIVPQIWEAEVSDELPAEISVEWYDRFIELCRENNIAVAAVFVPALGCTYDKVARWENTKVYLDSRGVDILDLNTYEAAKNMGFTPDQDIMEDNTHLTYMGSLRTSLALGNMLRERYGLPDHRGEETAAQWEAYWNEFCGNYEVPAEFR